MVMDDNDNDEKFLFHCVIFFVTAFTCEDRKRAIVSGDLAACFSLVACALLLLLVAGCLLAAC